MLQIIPGLCMLTPLTYRYHIGFLFRPYVNMIACISFKAALMCALIDDGRGGPLPGKLRGSWSDSEQVKQVLTYLKNTAVGWVTLPRIRIRSMFSSVRQRGPCYHCALSHPNLTKQTTDPLRTRFCNPVWQELNPCCKQWIASSFLCIETEFENAQGQTLALGSFTRSRSSQCLRMPPGKQLPVFVNEEMQ